MQATKAATEYYLEHQECDSQGNIETNIYKGDIIPTAGGGRSVVFRDKEVLPQTDPLSLDGPRTAAAAATIPSAKASARL